MKILLAAVVSIAFAASAAVACPGHDGAESKVVKKEEQDKGKQADAAKPKATPAPAKPAPAPAKPKADAPKGDNGKVSSAK